MRQGSFGERLSRMSDDLRGKSRVMAVTFLVMNHQRPREEEPAWWLGVRSDHFGKWCRCLVMGRERDVDKGLFFERSKFLGSGRYLARLLFWWPEVQCDPEVVSLVQSSTAAASMRDDHIYKQGRV